jgi:hypothetical protein
MGGTAAFVLKTKPAGSPEQQTLGPARGGGGQGVTRKRDLGVIGVSFFSIFSVCSQRVPSQAQ